MNSSSSSGYLPMRALLAKGQEIVGTVEQAPLWKLLCTTLALELQMSELGLRSSHCAELNVPEHSDSPCCTSTMSEISVCLFMIDDN